MNSSRMARMLLVDLGSREHKTFELDTAITEALVGGKGVGAKILYDILPAGADPLGAGNVLIFMTGPLTGTAAPAMRGCVITRSPLTGTFVDSYFGGHFAPEIKYAGYDGIVITGEAPTPLYLFIDDDRVEFRDASMLMGFDTGKTNRAIKSELRDPTVKVACIGPAAENKVRFGLISCEYNRQAGRGGTGAVMGSKNLKAVAIRGTHPVMIKEPDAFKNAVEKARSELCPENIGDFTTGGTACAVPFSSESSLLPVRNFQEGIFDKADRLDDAAQKKRLWLRDLACQGCPIRCSKMGKLRHGKYKGTISDAVEYELLAMLGSNLGISDLGAVVHLAERCDALGLDGMSAGGAIGFAMEAFEKGLIKTSDSDGVELVFGSVEAAHYLVDSIAWRKNDLGDVLAEGVSRASEKIGGREFAVHIKGLECPAWGPRSVPGMALALATADRGGCHQRAFPILYEVGGEWKGKPVDRTGLADKAEIVVHMQNRLAALDTLIKCDFAQYGIGEDTYRELLRSAAGDELSEEGLLELGERVWNQVKLFNQREGFDREDDDLPERFKKEPLPSGPFEGVVVKQADLQTLLDEYYGLRGWDKNGVPTDETIRRLGLDSLPRSDI